jgi:hypothetical protein
LIFVPTAIILLLLFRHGLGAQVGLAPYFRKWPQCPTRPFFSTAIILPLMSLRLGTSQASTIDASAGERACAPRFINFGNSGDFGNSQRRM